MLKKILIVSGRFLLHVVAIAVLYVAFTNRTLMGARFATYARFYATPSNWSDWTSVALWHIAVGWTFFRVLSYDSARKAVRRRLRRSPIRILRRVPSVAYARWALGFSILSFVVLSCWRFTDWKALWRFLRYSVLETIFYRPVTTLVTFRRFTIELLYAPALILGAVVLYLVIKHLKKRRPTSKSSLYFAAFVGSLFGGFGDERVWSADQEVESPRLLRTIRPAEGLDPASLDSISKAPSQKHWDGGYKVDASILKCFDEMEYTFSCGSDYAEEVRFRLRSPRNVVPGKKYPLIVWFHGFGESVGDNQRHLAHLHRAIKLFAGKEALDFYMLAVQCPKDRQTWDYSNYKDKSGKNNSPMTIAEEIYARLLVERPIDRERIETIGISSGGYGAWLFAGAHSEEVASLTVFSATPSSNLRAQDFVDMAIWTFNNEGDAAAFPAKTVAFVDEINALGGNARATVKPNGHHDSWSAPFERGDVFRWALSQSRGGVGRLQGVEYPRRSFVATFWKIYLPLAVILTLFVVRKEDFTSSRGGDE